MADTEIVESDEGSRAIAETNSANLIERIIDASTNTNVDAQKMETMTNLAIKLQDREMIAQFNRDLNAAIMEMPRITKRGRIVIPAKDGRPEREQGRFAKFEDIDFVVRPILNRHNLTIRFDVGHSDAYVTVTPILSHANGYVDRGEAMKLPIDTSGAKNNTQGAGSSTSYGKRYAMCAALNIVMEGEDDDGRGGSLASDPVSDVQHRLVEMGRQAAAEDRYQDWFDAQTPRDRAWLVQTGRHAEFGGEQENLPPPESVRSEKNQDDSSTPPPPPPPPPAGRKKRTPEQMVSDYETRIEKIESLDDLREFQSEKGTVKFTESIREKHPALMQRIIDANTGAAQRLAPDDDADEDRSGDDDLFGWR